VRIPRDDSPQPQRNEGGLILQPVQRTSAPVRIALTAYPPTVTQMCVTQIGVTQHRDQAPGQRTADSEQIGSRHPPKSAGM
jgi:hypothetical protein